jgi:hypothetical protein
MRRFAVETNSSPAFKQKAKTCRNGQPNPSRVSDRFYVSTPGSALATFRAARAWIEARVEAEGKTLSDFWYADGPEDLPELYEDQSPEAGHLLPVHDHGVGQHRSWADSEPLVAYSCR